MNLALCFRSCLKSTEGHQQRSSIILVEADACGRLACGFSRKPTSTDHVSQLLQAVAVMLQFEPRRLHEPAISQLVAGHLKYRGAYSNECDNLMVLHYTLRLLRYETNFPELETFPHLLELIIQNLQAFPIILSPERVSKC